MSPSSLGPSPPWLSLSMGARSPERTASLFRGRAKPCTREVTSLPGGREHDARSDAPGLARSPPSRWGGDGRGAGGGPRDHLRSWGRIQVGSQPGKERTFTSRLPRVPPGAQLPANALISHRIVPPLRPVSSPLVPFLSPLEGHTGDTCGPTGAICSDASGLSSPVSLASREARGRMTGACALARWNWGGAGGGAWVGVPAQAAGGDGAIRGGEGEPGHAAGGRPQRVLI
jgi:hypothetical protein